MSPDHKTNVSLEGAVKPFLVTKPDVAPVSLDELKKAVVVDFDDDDDLLQSLLDAAVSYLDGWSGVLGRALINQTWAIKLAEWPQTVRLPMGNASSATIKYLDQDGVKQTLSGEDYFVREDAISSVVEFKRGFGRPQTAEGEHITISFVTGYGAEARDVPAAILTAIKMLAAHWYANREATSSKDVQSVPMSVDALIAPFRRVHF